MKHKHYRLAIQNAEIKPVPGACKTTLTHERKSDLGLDKTPYSVKHLHQMDHLELYKQKRREVQIQQYLHLKAFEDVDKMNIQYLKKATQLKAKLKNPAIISLVCGISF